VAGLVKLGKMFLELYAVPARAYTIEWVLWNAAAVARRPRPAGCALRIVPRDPLAGVRVPHSPGATYPVCE